MIATMLLDELTSLDVRLIAHGDRLRVDAPKGVLTPELRQSLVEHKAELLALLAPLPEHMAEMQQRAFSRADRINDMLGITDPLVREINRVSWLIADLEDAGISEAVVRPLVEEKRRLGAEFERRAEIEAA